MTTYPYLNTRYTLPELCRLKGVNIETVYPKLKKAGKDADAVDIINLIAARVRFTWLSVAKAVGINPHTFNARIAKYGLETTLLMGSKLLRDPTNKKVHLVGKISAWDRPLPENDKDHALKNLTRSLMALGFEGKDLDVEIIKRAIG